MLRAFSCKVPEAGCFNCFPEGNLLTGDKGVNGHTTGVSIFNGVFPLKDRILTKIWSPGKENVHLRRATKQHKNLFI